MITNFLRLFSHLVFVSLLLFIFNTNISVQNDVMMQAFYWDVPVDAGNFNGSWFCERIIRDEKEFYFMSEYIVNNPANWGKGIIKKYFEDLSNS